MEPSSPSTSSVVLVVEDEMLVRMIAAEVLAEAGFTVIECASAEEALAVLHARADVQVVFTDVNMPGPLDGLTLVHIVHQQWPAVGIAIGSGRIRPNPGELPRGLCSSPSRMCVPLSRMLYVPWPERSKRLPPRCARSDASPHWPQTVACCTRAYELIRVATE